MHTGNDLNTVATNGFSETISSDMSIKSFPKYPPIEFRNRSTKDESERVLHRWSTNSEPETRQRSSDLEAIVVAGHREESKVAT